MEKYVTDLETSKRLFNAGVKHCYHFIHQKRNGIYDVVSVNVFFDFSLFTADYEAPVYPAYLLSELLEMVEGKIKKLVWQAEYNEWSFSSQRSGTNGDTPISAVAEALICEAE